MHYRRWPLKKGSSAKASNLFLVDRLVWKRLLIPHIRADATFRLPAISIFNRSGPQQGIPPSLSNPVLWFLQGTSFKNHSLLTGCGIKVYHRNCRKEKGTQLLLKYDRHSKNLQNKVWKRWGCIAKKGRWWGLTEETPGRVSCSCRSKLGWWYFWLWGPEAFRVMLVMARLWHGTAVPPSGRAGCACQPHGRAFPSPARPLCAAEGLSDLFLCASFSLEAVKVKSEPSSI